MTDDKLKQDSEVQPCSQKGYRLPGGTNTAKYDSKGTSDYTILHSYSQGVQQTFIKKVKIVHSLHRNGSTVMFNTECLQALSKTAARFINVNDAVCVVFVSIDTKMHSCKIFSSYEYQ